MLAVQELLLRPLLVFWLIVYCFGCRTRPWNFFQLNSSYFNPEKNIFSKLELDQHIPTQWRLWQSLDRECPKPEFPVFVKPEWGQNSNGVKIARDPEELQAIRQTMRKSRGLSYLLQQAAVEKREFEIFYVRSESDPSQPAIISVTETKNSSGDQLVVNGINNRASLYEDLSSLLNAEQMARLWSIIGTIGCFRIGRVGVRADSVDELLAGLFHVVEVNVFLPMPLLLLDPKLAWGEKHRFIRRCMKACARLIAVNDFGFWPNRRPIFFRKLIAHYKVKE